MLKTIIRHPIRFLRAYANRNNDPWDYRRVLWTYFMINRHLVSMGPDYEKWPIEAHVALLRLASVIRACMMWDEKDYPNPLHVVKMIFSDYGKISLTTESPISDASWDKLIELLRRYDSWFSLHEYSIMREGKEKFRMDMFYTLLQYRIKIDDYCRDSGLVFQVSLSDCGTNIAYELYLKQTLDSNDKIDEILGLLLGSAFEKPFTESELCKHYGYPKITDSDIRKIIRKSDRESPWEEKPLNSENY